MHRLVPKYMYIKCNSKSPQGRKAVESAFWLELGYKECCHVRENLGLHLKVIHTELTSKLNSVEFYLLDHEVRTNIREEGYLHYLTQQKKWDTLKRTKV